MQLLHSPCVAECFSITFSFIVCKIDVHVLNKMVMFAAYKAAMKKSKDVMQLILLYKRGDRLLQFVLNALHRSNH